MLRIAEHWYASDLGRQRQGNEDNFFVRAPLFVVADGMGGAQAGEVASEIAVALVRRRAAQRLAARGARASVIEQANQRIHEQARADESLHGMGTTTHRRLRRRRRGRRSPTSATRRAYLLRDGELIRLTKDHSLVGELVARGKLTEEQAEQHPQRSVITRALGPEANVQVDIDIFPAKRRRPVPALLRRPDLDGPRAASCARCSTRRDSLETLGKRLIDAANAAGGRDNITVILFRLEERRARGEAPARRPPRRRSEDTSEYETFEGEAVRAPRQGITRADAATQVGDDALRSADVADAVEDDYRAQRHRRAVGDPPGRARRRPAGGAAA